MKVIGFKESKKLNGTLIELENEAFVFVGELGVSVFSCMNAFHHRLEEIKNANDINCTYRADINNILEYPFEELRMKNALADNLELEVKN